MSSYNLRAITEVLRKKDDTSYIPKTCKKKMNIFYTKIKKSKLIIFVTNTLRVFMKHKTDFVTCITYFLSPSVPMTIAYFQILSFETTSRTCGYTQQATLACISSSHIDCVLPCFLFPDGTQCKTVLFCVLTILHHKGVLRPSIFIVNIIQLY